MAFNRAVCSAVRPRSLTIASLRHQPRPVGCWPDSAPGMAVRLSRTPAAVRWQIRDSIMRKPLKQLFLKGIRCACRLCLSAADFSQILPGTGLHERPDRATDKREILAELELKTRVSAGILVA